MIRWLIALPLLASCINIPKETAGDDDAAAIDAAVIDASPDARQLPVCISNVPTGTVLAVTMNSPIYTAATGMLNDDNCLDLVLGQVGINPGFYVFYGPITDFTDLKYHEFVSTGVPAVAIAVDDVVGGAKPEVLVFGSTSPMNDPGVIEVYEASTLEAPLFSDTVPQQITTGFTPGAGALPVNMVVGNFGGNSDSRDILVSGLNDLELYASTGGNLASYERTVVSRENNETPSDWIDINKLILSETSGNSNLLVVEQSIVSNIHYNGTTFQTEVFAQQKPVTTVRTLDVVDLDNTPPLDIVGGGSNTLAAWQIANDANGVAVQKSTPLTLDNNGVEMWQLSVLPTPSGPYLVTFEQGPPAQLVHRELGFSLKLNSFSDAAPIETPLSNIGVPITAIVADLDNDGAMEYRVFSESGQTKCYVPDTNGLKECTN